MPRPQLLQCVTAVCAKSESPYRPTSHCVQNSLLAGLHVPAAHIPLHALVVAAAPPNRPAAQGLQNVSPRPPWNLPGRHGRQCEAPA